MIGIATLAFLSLTPQPGVLFECRSSLSAPKPHLRVFAPASGALDAYRIDTALRAAPETPGFKIEDKLPGRLDIHWRREHSSPVHLTISHYDAKAGTASYGLITERNPASALYTQVAVAGACTARAANAADLQDLTQ